MMRKAYTLLLGLLATAAQAQPVASFSADEAKSAYYTQNWDSQTEANTWTYTSSNADYTWYISDQVSLSGLKPFSSIESDSKSSLAIDYNTNQDETATSPVITIRDNSDVEFYLGFYGVWLVYADLTLSVVDKTANETTQLFSAFKWAQDNNYTGPNWLKFSFDLSAYAGHEVQFAFNYKGSYGDNMYVDAFKVNERDLSDNATITINEGESVHFTDASTGNPTAWTWTFEGGTPATSSEQNPVVTYEKGGTYNVTLTASNADGQSTATRMGYVKVIVPAPTALIGVPAEGYLSPYAYCFVPTNVPVTFTDLSTGKPTEWYWTFEGATPETSAEQNPTVTYTEAGTYGLTLDVTNSAGTSHDFLTAAIQAGGKQEVWNIAPEETTELGGATLGWYGYYGGTNWLGMTRFAEEFAKPAVKAVIDTVTVYFNTTTTVTPDTTITVAICRKAADGTPGEVLGSGQLRASELKYDAQYVVPTYFQLDNPVTVDEPFFVVIDGFPNNSTDEGTDDISVLCVLRDEGAKCTAWHELADEDENYQYTGTYTWYRNDDSPLSLAICPLLQYQDASNSIASAQTDETATTTARYNLSGQAVQKSYKGVVVERMSNGKARKTLSK